MIDSPSMFRLIAFALFGGTVFTIPAVAAEQAAKVGSGIFRNGTLEAGDGWPEGWPRVKNGVRWEVEAGNHFLRLESSKPGEMVLVPVVIPLPNGCEALSLSFRMRCTGLKPGKEAWFDARVLTEFKDATGKRIDGGFPAIYTRADTSGWVERTVACLVPSGAARLDFMPTLFQVESGMFDLDDVAIVVTDPVPLQIAAEQAATERRDKQTKAAVARRAKADANYRKTGSLLSNGHLEAAAKSGDAPADWGGMKDGRRWEEEAGNHYLRLVSESPGATVLVYRTVDLPTGVEALEMTWRQRITNLKPGKEPWHDARIMLEFKDVAGKKLTQKPSPPYSRSNTEGWVAKTIQFLVPPEALSLEFMPALFQVEHGTFDLDDIVLKPIEAAPLIAAAKERDEEFKRSLVLAEKPVRDKWPRELHVEGNRIVDSTGKPVWLQGVNIVSLEWSATGERVMKATQVAIEDWKANTIRLPVKDDYWFGRAAGQKDGGAAYRQLVDDVITLAANRGVYTVLDLHRFRAPKAEHVEFWKDVAERYKNHPAVLFDLFNEPHGISWDVWRDGGFVAEKSQPANADENAFLSEAERAKAAEGFPSPGMQKLLDAVRETGAKNVVIVGGLDWSYDLSGIAEGYVLKDRAGHGIMYSTHIYPWKRDWENKVLRVAKDHPIFVGETGANLKKMTFIPAEGQEDAATWVPAMLGLIQTHHLNWTGFSFHPGASPVMIKDWTFTPTPEWGQPAKDALGGKLFELDRLR